MLQEILTVINKVSFHVIHAFFIVGIVVFRSLSLNKYIHTYRAGQYLIHKYVFCIFMLNTRCKSVFYSVFAAQE